MMELAAFRGVHACDFGLPVLQHRAIQSRFWKIPGLSGRKSLNIGTTTVTKTLSKVTGIKWSSRVLLSHLPKVRFNIPPIFPQDNAFFVIGKPKKNP